jgi:hypothetical protein
MVTTEFINEKRLTSRLLTYWTSLCDVGETIPHTGKYNASSISDVTPFCCQIRVQFEDGGNPHFFYEAVGRSIRELIGRDPSGQPILPGSSATLEGRIIKDLTACLGEAKPTYDEGQFFNNQSKVVKYRSCNLPFHGRVKDDISMILIGFSCKVF